MDRSRRNYLCYKKLRNRSVQSVRNDHDKYRKKVIRSFKGNPKKFFGYMRSLQTVRPKVSRLVNKNGELSETDQEAAEVLCEFFHGVVVAEYDSRDIKLAETEMRKIPVCFDRDEVKDLLLSLKTDKSPGRDCVHPMVLQRRADELSLPLSIIFQKSFDSGRVPADWKLAVVSPIFKKRNKSDAGNYRPVSLTSVPCKIMETMIKTELVKYLETNGIMSNCQHGFTTGR